MFAVPGWSVSADNLKTEVEDLSTRKNAGKVRARNDKQLEKISKKRKRGQAASEASPVTETNLRELWQKHLDHKVEEDENEAKEGAVNRGKEGSKRAKVEKHKRKAVDASRKEGQVLLNGDEVNGNVHPERLAVFLHSEAIKRPSSKAPRPSPSAIQGTAEDGLARYQNGKAKADEKRRRKALKAANNEEKSSAPNDSLKTPPLSSKKTPSLALQKAEHPPDPPIRNALTSKPLLTTQEAPAPSKQTLTPLQQRMAQKLTSARFRHLNETLYTSPSSEAMSLFASNVQAYSAYHAGFRAQVAVWPSNPVEQFIQTIKARGAVRAQGSGLRGGRGVKEKSRGTEKGKQGRGAAVDTIEPLPRDRRTGTCHIIDLGCGDARLAVSLLPVSSPKQFNLRIRSFDLAREEGQNPGQAASQTSNPPSSSSKGTKDSEAGRTRDLVTIADITNLLPAGVTDTSVNVAICCLSLMNTNWVRVVDECARVVRPGGGEVWIAEIRSRFVASDAKRRAKDRTGSSGDGQGGKAKKNKRMKGGANGDDDGGEDEFSELEDKPAPRNPNETDVSAFVDVWARRGFVLKGEPDQGNKMFVTMRFVKAKAERPLWKEKKGGSERPGVKKFLDRHGDDGDTLDPRSDEAVLREGKVLKACLYKTR